jgi:hypothetical protein
MPGLSKTANAVNQFASGGFFIPERMIFFKSFLNNATDEAGESRLSPLRTMTERLTCETELPTIILDRSMNDHFNRSRNGTDMESNPEKRGEDRQTCDASIEWAYFNKGESFSARLLNFSTGGGYFVSGQPLIPGATILIRLRSVEPGDADAFDRSAMRTTALGEVKWCRPIGATPAASFGIGVRYHFPV